MAEVGVSGARKEGSDRSPGQPPLKSGGPVAQRARVAPTDAAKRNLLTRSRHPSVTSIRSSINPSIVGNESQRFNRPFADFTPANLQPRLSACRLSGAWSPAAGRHCFVPKPRRGEDKTTPAKAKRVLLLGHHVHESLVQKGVRQAARKAGLTKRVTSHTFRHSFATHLLADGYDIRTVQELLGHKDVRTTMVYTHVLNRGGRGVQSPADGLDRLPR